MAIKTLITASKPLYYEFQKSYLPHKYSNCHINTQSNSNSIRRRTNISKGLNLQKNLNLNKTKFLYNATKKINSDDIYKKSISKELENYNTTTNASSNNNSSASIQLENSTSLPYDEESKTESKPFIKQRWLVVGLCFVAFLLCNMDRVNMSISVLPMSEQFNWNSQTKGIVQSSFFWGYLLTQILGGIWADKFGGKPVLGFGVIWWSLATAFTPIAAQLGLPVLLLARACMGIGEGVAMPAMNNMLSKWVPKNERSRSLAFVYSGMFVGSMVGLAVSPQMIAMFKWPSVFYSFGSLGIVWFLLWKFNVYSTPSEHPKITESEKEYILSNSSSQVKVDKIPWKLLLSKKEVWAIIICHFCHNWGTFILLTWMPTYYNQALGLDLMSCGIYSVLPWITMAVTANLGGWIADSLVPRLGVTAVRKIMQSIGFLGPAFFLTQLSHVEGVYGAVACMMGSQGLDAFSQSGLYSNHQDIGPKYAGVLLGMSNTAGVLAGVLGTLATGYILQNGTWDQVWHLSVFLYLLGTVVWNVFSTGERVFD